MQSALKNITQTQVYELPHNARLCDLARWAITGDVGSQITPDLAQLEQRIKEAIIEGVYRLSHENLPRIGDVNRVRAAICGAEKNDAGQVLIRSLRKISGVGYFEFDNAIEYLVAEGELKLFPTAAENWPEPASEHFFEAYLRMTEGIAYEYCEAVKPEATE